jgi:hypothetical protein
VSLLYDFLCMVRSVRRARPNDETTTGCKIDSVKQRMYLHWHRRLDPRIIFAPSLYLDATADEILSRLPFQYWDGSLLEEGECVECEIEFKKIDVAAPHRALVKVVNAPVGKRSFDNNGTELKEIEQKRRRRRKADARTADDAGAGDDGRADENTNKNKKRVPKLMSSHASWAEVLRVSEAICGRAVANGQEAGFTSYLNVERYADEFGLLKGVKKSHLGKLRGRNAQEKVSVLAVVGRLLPDNAALDTRVQCTSRHCC